MNGKIRKGRRLLSLLLAFTLCLTLTPTAAFAEETPSGDSELISITLPEGVETAEESGELTQTVSAGAAMADIRLASSYADEPFDESYADAFNARLFEGTGLSANCDEDGVITISGTPAADVVVNLADAFAEDEPVTVSDSSAVYVSSSGNDTNGDGSQDKPYATISKAYTVVADGGTIYLLSDVDVTTTGITFDANKTVTITSADSSDIKTIYSKIQFGYDNKTMMTVTVGEVIFKNITIDGTGQRQSGNKANSPGCIYVTKGGATATLDTGTTIENFWKNSGTSGGSSVLKSTISGAQINIKDGVLITGCVLEAGNTDDPSSVISSGTGGIVYMTGGKVTGNTLSTSQSASTAIVNIGMISNPHFWMTGGEITGNTINNGAAAVYMRGEANACDMQFGDTAYVYGNYVNGTDGDQRNIYLKNDKDGEENDDVFVKLCSALTDTAKLGVYAEKIGMGTKVAQGGRINDNPYTATAADATYFVSDKETGAEILYCGGDDTTCGLLQHDTNHNSNTAAIYLSVSPAVTAEKNEDNNIDLSITRCTSDATYVVLDKDMKPVTCKTLTGGAYETGGNGTFKLSNADTTTTIGMPGLDKANGPYTVMLVNDGSLTVDSTTGKASTNNLTDIATVNIVNFAGDGVTWSDGETNFENGGFDIVTVPHNDQTGKATKTYTATASTGYTFVADNAVTASGNLNTAGVTDNDNGSKTVSVEVPAYGTTSKGTSGYSSVTLTGATVLSTGVKLLNKTGGSDMTVTNGVTSKVYDGNAVAYTAGSIDGATLTCTWQQKNADSEGYTNITGNTAPSDAGEYNLKVTATKTDESTEIGTQNLPFTISQKELGVTVNATTKEYDGKTDATATVTLNTGEVVTNDNVTLDDSDKKANFADEAVGENKTVTVTGLKLTGADAANYKLPESITTTANITKASGSGTVMMQGWTYGKTANSPVATSTTNSETVTYQYKLKNAADTAYSATVPTNAGEYTVKATFPTNDNYTEATATADFTIAKKALTVIVTVQDKTYDGTATAQLSTATLNGVETADVSKVTLVTNGVTAAFSDADVDENKNITLTGDYTLTGSAAENYTLTQPTGLTASITKASQANCTLNTAGDRGKENTFSVPGENIVAGGTVGTITVSDTDTIFDGTPTYSDGTLTYKLNSNATDNQTATVTLPVTSTNYNNYNIVVTVTVKSKETVTITITAADGGYVYNGSSQTPTFTVTGNKVDAESLDVTYTGRDGTTYTGSATAPTNAGKYTMTVKVPDSNTQYTGSATCDFEIAKKTLTATITAESKTYNGNTTATVTPTLDGVVASDDGKVTATVTNPAFENKNVGDNKNVAASISLTGAAAVNYNVNATAETTASITAKEVTISGVTVKESKTYDKTITANITNNGTIDGKIDTDSLEITAGTASYENETVGTNKTVNFSGFALTGTDAGNYHLTGQPASTTAAITAKEVTISGVTIDTTKVYDGNNEAKIKNSGTLTGVLDGDTVTIKTGTATYNDKNVGESKTVTFGGFELEGADAGNYRLTQPESTTAAITQREVSISGMTATKVYDGDNTAENQEITGTPVVGNKALDTDDVSVSTAGMAGTFDTSAVGENKTVTITGLSLTGNDAANYKLPTTVTCTGTITTANGSGTVTLDGWTYGETAKTPIPTSTTNPETVTYQYKLKNAADTAYSATVPTNAGEYTVKATFPANENYGEATDTADFTISPKELTVNVTAANKTYDGEVTAQLNTATLSGAVDGDDVTLVTNDVTAAFSDANVGNNKTITLTGTYTLTGDAAENYTLTQPSGLTANIDKKVLTITPKDVSISRGTTPTFELDYVGLVSEESVTLADPTYTVKDSSDNDITLENAIQTAGTYTVTVSGTLPGDSEGNYECKFGTGTLTVNKPSSGGGSTAADSGKFDVPVSGDKTEMKIEGEISGNTVVVSEVTKKDIETVGEGENVVIELESLNKNINSAKLTVSTLENVLNSEAKGLEIKLPNAIVTIDKTTLEALTEQAIDDLQLVIEPDEAARKTLNSAQEKSISELVRPTIVEAFFTSFGNRISDFKGGEVSVSVPFYTDKPIRAWYLKEDGTREKVGAVYDKVHATLTLTHFSHYAIEELENEDYNVTYASCPKDATCPIEPFPDAVNKEWYHDGCHFCIDNGLMVGFPDGNFYPYGDVTRAQVVTILWRLEGSLETDNAMNFADVPDGKWFTEAIRWATSNGVVTGYSDKAFGPNDAITREQFASILWRYSKLKGYDVSVGENTNILDYEDAAKVSSYAVSAMKWACGSGMISGVTSDTLVPGGVTSRAQAATMFMRYCAEIVK